MTREVTRVEPLSPYHRSINLRRSTQSTPATFPKTRPRVFLSVFPNGQDLST